MKIITIGDIHGSHAWKTIKPGDWDNIIFIGDYVDSVFYHDKEIKKNLEEIIDLKKLYPEKVILLWGNHDLSYFFSGDERHYASGFRKNLLPDFLSLYTANRKLFQAAFAIDHYLWTHAGVVQKWFNDYIAGQIKKSDRNLAFTLNRLFDAYYLPLFHVGRLRGGLNEKGGIFWADKSETENDPLMGYHQIVGHTKTSSGVRVSNHYRADTTLTWVDCLETETEFFKIELTGSQAST